MMSATDKPMTAEEQKLLAKVQGRGFSSATAALASFPETVATVEVAADLGLTAVQLGLLRAEPYRQVQTAQ